MVLGVRLGPEAGVPTSRSQHDDGDEGDQSDEDHGGDDAVAEHSPGGATALLGGRSCTHPNNNNTVNIILPATSRIHLQLARSHVCVQL